MRYRVFSYDIPEASDIPSPCGELHRRGIRMQLSAWIIPEHRIPWNLIESMVSQGATCDLYRFDQDEESKIGEKVVDSLRKEVERATKAAEHAERAAREATDGGQISTERVKYARKAKAACGLAMRRLASAQACSEGFREERVLSDIENARRLMHGLRARVEHQAETYARMTVAIGQLPGEHAAGMTAAAREDDLPAEIGADYLLDHSEARAEELAQQIQRAFGQ